MVEEELKRKIEEKRRAFPITYSMVSEFREVFGEKVKVEKTMEKRLCVKAQKI